MHTDYFTHRDPLSGAHESHFFIRIHAPTSDSATYKMLILTAREDFQYFCISDNALLSVLWRMRHEQFLKARGHLLDDRKTLERDLMLPCERGSSRIHFCVKAHDERCARGDSSFYITFGNIADAGLDNGNTAQLIPDLSPFRRDCFQ